MDALGNAETLHGQQRLTAAAAAVADEVDAFPIVLAKLHQAMIICLMQQIDAFFLADGTAVIRV